MLFHICALTSVIILLELDKFNYVPGKLGILYIHELVHWNQDELFSFFFFHFNSRFIEFG